MKEVCYTKNKHHNLFFYFKSFFLSFFEHFVGVIVHVLIQILNVRLHQIYYEVLVKQSKFFFEKVITNFHLNYFKD